MDNTQFPVFNTNTYHSTVLYQFKPLGGVVVPYTGLYSVIFGHVF
jgi:hypothetical protein